MFLVFIIFMLMLTLCRDTFVVLQLVGYNSLLGKKKKKKKKLHYLLYFYTLFIYFYISLYLAYVNAFEFSFS